MTKTAADWLDIPFGFDTVAGSPFDAVRQGAVAEHLPGKHDQRTHAKGGVSGVLAGDLKEKGGGSYESHGLKPITTGAVVARSGHSGVFDRERFLNDREYRTEQVNAYLKANRSEFAQGGQLGTWDSGREGGKTIVFDVIDNVSRQEAIRLGTERGEDGIYDLDTQEYVPTGGKSYTPG